MRPGAAFVPFAMVAVVLLAACTSSTSGSPADPGSSDPVSAVPTISSPATSTPTSPPASVSRAVPADVPTTGPNLLHKGERPPVMPELATKHTPAGAVAFAKFFELTIDWGYATTSTAYMKHYYEPSCITCKSIAAGIDGAAAKGHHFRGGRMTITKATDRGRDPAYGGERSVEITFRLTSDEVVTRQGVFVDAEPALTLTDRLHLAWHGRAWQVTEISPQP